MRQGVQFVSSPCRGDGLLSREGEDESIGGTLGGAPGLLRCMTNIARLEACDGLGVDLSGVGEEFYDAVTG